MLILTGVADAHAGSLGSWKGPFLGVPHSHRGRRRPATVGGAGSLGYWKGPFLGFLILTGVADTRLQWAVLVLLALGKGRSWGFLILTGVADARLQRRHFSLFTFHFSLPPPPPSFC